MQKTMLFVFFSIITCGFVYFLTLSLCVRPSFCEPEKRRLSSSILSLRTLTPLSILLFEFLFYQNMPVFFTGVVIDVCNFLTRLIITKKPKLMAMIFSSIATHS